MTEGIRNLCMLEVVGAFKESIRKRAYNAFRYGDAKVVLDVSDYRAYCERLLSNNGLSPERDMKEIEKFMGDILFVIFEITGITVSALQWLDFGQILVIR